MAANSSPAPGTPADSLYGDIRLPIPENGYQFATKTQDYPLPLTVHRPYFSHIGDQTLQLGQTLTLTVSGRNPANGVRTTQPQPAAVIEALDGGLTYGTAGLLPLGDMAISLERAKDQAKRFGNTLKREVGYLTIHSILHLLGYDHMDEGEMKRQMRTREEIIAAQIGITR